MASIKHLVDIDLNKNQITNVKLQHISGDPSGTGEDYEGRLFYDSSANAVKFHNGSSFVALGTSNASGDITAVTAGDGLTGGGASGDVTLAVGVDDSSIEINSDALRVKASGVTNAMLAGSIAASKLAGSIGDSKLSTITTANKVGLAALDIDGGTDIGAALADADLMIVDDGAGGTNRKATMSRLKTYMQNNLTFTTNTNTVDMGDGFVIEDADGTEVTITENKEVKFIGAGGLTINWTDVDSGADADPYDLTFTIGTLNQDTTGTATNATNAAHVLVTDNESTDEENELTFVEGAAGGGANRGLESSAKATFNPSNGKITATGFIGALTGNADTVTTNANLTGDVTSSGNATTIASGAVHHGMLSEDIISGQGALTSGLASTDELMISDAGTVKRMDVSVIQSYLQSNLTFTTNTDADVSVANLKTALADGFPSDAATIGDANDTITFANDVVISGDLNVTGDTVTTTTTTITTQDPIIRLANNNAADTIDVGFYGTYVATVDGSSATRFTGLFRDADEDTDSWTLFKDLTAEPTTTINTAHSSYSLADLKLGTLKATAITGALTGNVTGNVSGSSGSCTGAAATVTSIGNLTGDITSSNRATTISSGAVHHGMLSDDIISGQGALTSGLASTDELMISDAGTVKRMDVSVLQSYLQSALTFTTNTNTVDMGDGFVIEDGDGTEVTITENKEIKFVEGGNIDINFTDTSTGSDGDPFDLSFSVPDASASTKGAVELATTAEALAGTDTARAVTAAGLAARSYRVAIGNGSATAITVNHALGTRDVMVQLYDASSYETLVAQVVRTDTANITVTFNSAPASNDVICLVTKID